MNLDAAAIGHAIVVWTGWGETQWPARSDERLAERFGQNAASQLLPHIRELEREFYKSDARFTAADLKEMGDVAADQFRRVHPELPDDAVRALAWCFTYDYK